MTTIGFVLAFCLVALFVYMARYSGRLRVEEKHLVDAPLAEVWVCVADLRRWREWNPWLEHEPDVPLSLSDRSDAEGSRLAWDSERIGSGLIEHRRLQAPRRIEQRVRFQAPFRFKGRAVWTFAERGGKTEVTWQLRGRVAFRVRAFAKTVQETIVLDFRYGLEKLAARVEPAGSSRYSLAYLGVEDAAAARCAAITYSGPLGGLRAAVRDSVAELRRELARRGVAPAGAPVALYSRTNIKLRTTVCHIGIPVGDAVVDGLEVRELPAHRGFGVRLAGSLEGLEVAWYQAMQGMRIDGIEPDQRIAPFERYLVDPGAGPEIDGQTELFIPVRQRG